MLMVIKYFIKITSVFVAHLNYWQKKIFFVSNYVETKYYLLNSIHPCDISGPQIWFKIKKKLHSVYLMLKNVRVKPS